MNRPPRKRTERLLSLGWMLRGYAFLGLISSAVLIATLPPQIAGTSDWTSGRGG
jgi:hypothetical protein